MAQPHFVYDNLQLSPEKQDLSPIPVGADPTQYVQATEDWNPLRQAALDMRNMLREAKFYGLEKRETDPAPVGITTYMWARNTTDLVLHMDGANYTFLTSSRSIYTQADSGLQGGGSLSGDLHLSIRPLDPNPAGTWNHIEVNSRGQVTAGTLLDYVEDSRQVLAGDGLSGGGDLSADVTLSLPDSGVTAGDYIVTSLTVDAKGRITAASSGTAHPLTTKGDLFTYSTTVDRLPVGSDGQFLVADALETTGLKWYTLPTYALAARTLGGTAGRITGGGDLSADRTFDLASGIITPGTYTSLTVDTYGRATGGTNPGFLTSAYYQTVQSNTTPLTQRNVLNFSSRFAVTDDSGNGRTDVELATSGISAGAYVFTKLTFDTYGRATASTTDTGFTAGSVLFVGTSGVVAQDNATLFWDNTNKRLAIGTNNPAATSTLEINKAAASLELNVINTQATGGTQFLLGSSTTGGTYGYLFYGGASFVGGDALQASRTTLVGAAVGGLALCAGHASGMVVIYTGGPAAANERVRITSGGQFLLNSTNTDLGVLGVRSTSTKNGIDAVESTGSFGLSFRPSTTLHQIYSNYYDVGGADRALALGTYANRANQLYLRTDGNSCFGTDTTLNSSRLTISGTISATGAYLSGLTTGSLIFAAANGQLSQDNTSLFWDAANKRLGVGQGAPTAALHLKAGTASASTAPLKFASGVNLTAPEDGAIEYDGTAYYGTITSGPTRKTFAFTADVVPNTRNVGTAARLSGGGALSADLTLDLASGVCTPGTYSGVTVDTYGRVTGGTSTSYAPTTTTITAGNGLAGGGDLSTNRTLDVGAGTGISVGTDAVSIDTTAALNWTGAASFTGLGFATGAHRTLKIANNDSSYNLTLTTGDALATDTGTGSLVLDVGTPLGTGVAGNLTLGATNATELKLGRSGGKLSFFGATAVVRTAAYSAWGTGLAATRTNPTNYTADDESTAYTSTPAALGDAATLADLNALRAAYETLRAMAEAVGKTTHQLYDDLKTYGLLQESA